MILDQVTLFPQATVPLFIFEPRYRTMLRDALDTHRMFCVAMRDPAGPEEAPYPVAGLGVLRAAFTHDDGTSHIFIQGMIRVRLGRIVRRRPYRTQEFEPLMPEPKESLLIDALAARTLDLVETRLKLAADDSPELFQQAAARVQTEQPATLDNCMEALREIDDAAQLADFTASTLLTSPESRQAVLEAVDIEERLRRVVQFLMGELKSLGHDSEP